MKKVWIYKRKNIKGWWVGWYESGRRKAKVLHSKELAEHYKHIKYTQLNSDVFTGIVAADWQQMIDEYREAKKVRGVTEGRFTKLHCPYETLNDLQERVAQNRLPRIPLTGLYYKEGPK
jgi:hypothetical protein